MSVQYLVDYENVHEAGLYDAQFPQHPLSEMRRFVSELISLN